MVNLLKNKKWAIIFSLFAMLLWGSAIPMIKNIYVYGNITDTGGKILVAGIRFFIAGIITLIYFKLFSGEKVEGKSINYRLIFVLAITQTAIQYMFYYIGLSNTLGTMASVIQASNAFIVVIISVLFIKDEKLTKKKILALVLGTIGVLILNLRGGEIHFKLTGEGFIIIATVFNALSSVIIRKYSRGQNPFILNAGQFIIGSLFLIFLGIFMTDSALDVNPAFLTLLLYGSFISATAFSIWTIVLQNHSSSEFGIYKLFIPIFGTILSVIILGEELTINIIIAMAFVLSGALVLNKK
ncbi:DMT family transporter [Peptoniphilus sp. MSJ-1]|uniref:DMT family transporter n=1 Tax=Peptoniphilus ovalis TaxID=2841503 RepID=A0ABS6FIQ5_9FIRM|nr:DMT family transporter [Peptoniphilus ovalis]MBU5669889.1 DMT family transporter [Peptoniphilus ovalis]